MILVRSLLQQLSGNKVLLILLSVIVLSSCFSQKFNAEQKMLEKAYKQKQKEITVKDSLPDLTKKDTIVQPVIKIKKNYKIAVILPLQLNGIYGEEFEQSKLSIIAQEYYTGLRLGLQDTMEKSDLHYTIEVFDNVGSKEQTTQLLQNDISKFQPDIIIGPLLSKNVKLISKYSLENEIPMISPFSNSDTCLKENPYFISLRPPITSYIEYISQILETYYKNDNIIICNSSKAENESFLASIEDSRKFSNLNTCETDIVNWRSAPYLKYMQKEHKNVFVFTNDNEVVINSIITNMVSREEDIEVIVPFYWLDHKSVDINYLQKMHTSFISPLLVDYKDSLTQVTIRNYREQYKTEPSSYAFNGYYLMQYLKMGIGQDGSEFYKKQHEANSGIFIIEQYPGGQGYINKLLETYKLHKFELIKLEDFIKMNEEAEKKEK